MTPGLPLHPALVYPTGNSTLGLEEENYGLWSHVPDSSATLGFG